MIGAILGAAVQVGSSLIGGIKAAKERRKNQELMDKAKKEWDAWYTNNRYADPTMRASARYMLNKNAMEAVNRLAAAKGRGAIMGNADANVAAAQEANAQGMADAVGKVAAMNDARVDKIDEEYHRAKTDLQNKEMGYNEQSAQNIANTYKEIGGVAQQIAGNDAGEVASAGSKYNLGASSYPTNLGATESEAATEKYMNEYLGKHLKEAAGIKA